MTSFRLTWFQILVYLAALAPLGLLILDFYRNNLTVNPIQEVTLRTGKTALVLLVLTLSVTPVNTIFGFRRGLKVRRGLGLFAFFYASLHFLIFIGLDYGFDLRLIWLELAEKRYILAGFAAFLILIPLAVTSTKGWQKRLGKVWKRLHRWVYLAGILVIVHYIWLVKSDIREPLLYGAVVVFLLAARIPWTRKRLVHLRAQVSMRLRRTFSQLPGGR